jgi:hypothetical protein
VVQCLYTWVLTLRLVTQLHTTHSEATEWLAGIVAVGTVTTDSVSLKTRQLHFSDKKNFAN